MEVAGGSLEEVRRGPRRGRPRVRGRRVRGVRRRQRGHRAGDTVSIKYYYYLGIINLYLPLVEAEQGGEGGGGRGHGGGVTRGRRGEEGEGGVVRVVEVWRAGHAGHPGAREQRHGVAALRRGPRARQLPAVHVHPGVLLLPLGPPVLEPDLHLQHHKYLMMNMKQKIFF